MHAGTELIRLPIILFTMLLLASCGNDGPTPEDTSTDVARKFLIHFWNEEFEEASEYCLGSNYSYDLMRELYEFQLRDLERSGFGDVDDLIDAIDFDSPTIYKSPNLSRDDAVELRKYFVGAEVVEGQPIEKIRFQNGLDGSRLGVIVKLHATKEEGIWKVFGKRQSQACISNEKMIEEMLSSTNE